MCNFNFQCSTREGTVQVGKALVRFPNSLGCELGERRSYSLWIELPGPIVQKKLLEVARWAQNWNRQHKNSEFWSAKLSKLHWVRLQRGICPFLQFATSPSSDLPLVCNAFSLLYFSISLQSYFLGRAFVMNLPSSSWTSIMPKHKRGRESRGIVRS